MPLTSFEELLVSRTTRKAQQNSWKDPSKNWGQNEGLQKAEEQEKQRRKLVTCVSRRESYLSFLCIVLSQEDGHPRVREAYRC